MSNDHCVGKYTNPIGRTKEEKTPIRTPQSIHRITETAHGKVWALHAICQDSSQENPQKVGESVKLEPVNKQMTPSYLFVPKETCM